MEREANRKVARRAAAEAAGNFTSHGGGLRLANTLSANVHFASKCVTKRNWVARRKPRNADSFLLPISSLTLPPPRPAFSDTSRHAYCVLLWNQRHLLPNCIGKIAFGIAFRRGAFRIPTI